MRGRARETERKGSMRQISGVIVIALCLWICGCGSGSNNPGPGLNIVAGNWQVSAASTASPGTIGLGGASLSQTGNTVSGIMHLVLPPCFNFIGDTSLNGTVSGSTLKLTTSLAGGQALTVTLTGTEKLLTGTYSLSGGSCGPPDQGTITLTFVPPSTGTWHGTLAAAGGGPVTQGTANVPQSGPDTHGFFALSGTATFSGSCLVSGTVSGIANGAVDVLIVAPSDVSISGDVRISGVMSDPATATAFSGAYVSTES